MSTREIDMLADRELRDAALELVKVDIANVKEDLSAKGIKDRVTSRLTDGALEVFEEATELADNNRGVLATLLAAVGIWFARNPILAVLGLEDESLADEAPATGATGDFADDADDPDQTALPLGENEE